MGVAWAPPPTLVAACKLRRATGLPSSLRMPTSLLVGPTPSPTPSQRSRRCSRQVASRRSVLSDRRALQHRVARRRRRLVGPCDRARRPHAPVESAAVIFMRFCIDSGLCVCVCIDLLYRMFTVECMETYFPFSRLFRISYFNARAVLMQSWLGVTVSDSIPHAAGTRVLRVSCVWIRGLRTCSVDEMRP